ncbi:MAG: RNA polymerase sigma factor [Chloroflexi bacterium]|nr:RNA polymerase sigma factor [Chloroflexota bacterium]
MMTFHDLYEQYAPDVYRFAFWLSGSAADADDITAETFVRAWAGSQKIRTETVKAYLFTIARNLYLKQAARARREVALDETLVAPLPEPDGQLARREVLTAVFRQLHQLSEADRTAFILRIQYELPYAEIARILAISEAAAKVKVHRARLKLTAVRRDYEEA